MTATASAQDYGQTATLKIWDNTTAPHSNGITTPETEKEPNRVRNTSEATLYIFPADPAKATPTPAPTATPEPSQEPDDKPDDAEESPSPADENHEHEFAEKWSFDEERHWHECSCGDKKDTAAHTAGEWIIDTPATATTDGSKHKECTVCKRVLERAYSSPRACSSI